MDREGPHWALLVTCARPLPIHSRTATEFSCHPGMKFTFCSIFRCTRSPSSNWTRHRPQSKWRPTRRYSIAGCALNPGCTWCGKPRPQPPLRGPTGLMASTLMYSKAAGCPNPRVTQVSVYLRVNKSAVAASNFSGARRPTWNSTMPFLRNRIAGSIWAQMVEGLIWPWTGENR